MNELEKEPRPRLVLEVDPSFQQEVKRVAKERGVRMRDFCLTAIHQALKPGLSFHSPRTPGEMSLVDFLTEGRRIVYGGLILSALHDESFITFLEQKIEREKVPMTFITFDPAAREDDLVFQLLDRQHGPTLGKSGLRLRGAAQHTLKSLARLHRKGQEHYVEVRVLASAEYPTFGLTIIDPFTPRCRMRIRMYLHLQPHEVHPFWDIDMGTPEGATVGQTFLDHYLQISQRARVIENFDPA